MKVARGSKKWILLSVSTDLVFLILAFLSNQSDLQIVLLLFTIALFLKTAAIIIFFRDPDRDIGKGIVAAADGRIREISKLKDKDIGDCTNISTFMNVYNVHVNRISISGKIKDVVHKHGIHLPAFKKESEKNERVITTIDSDIGTIKIIQIAGTLARRIDPYIKKGDKLKKGDKIGIIKFGSRVDVYLPSKKIKIKVKVGDMIKAGESTIAEIND
jgi:phosphatidylserine decarboxylase